MGIRSRITAAVVLVLAIGAGGGALLVVANVRGALDANVALDNMLLLESIRPELEAGVPPEQVELLMWADGTELRIESPDGTVLAPSDDEFELLTSSGVATELTAEQSAALDAELRRSLELGPDEPLPDDVEMAATPDELAISAAEVQLLDRLDEHYEALEDDANWARTELEVTTPTGPMVLVARTPVLLISRRLDVFRRTVWWTVPVVVLIAGGLTWFGIGQALRPIGRMTERVRGITAGSLDERVPESGSGDEVDKLAHTMNDMLGRLEGSQQRQRQFVSDASHELRSPITAIRTEAEVVLDYPDKADAQVLAKVAHAEGGRLARLVDDLLALATADEQPARALRKLDLDDLVFQQAARSRRVPVSTAAVSAARVRGDEAQLERLVANLLDNATRHAGTAVAVALDAHDSEVLLQVDDDGSGVDARDREAIFERFSRLQQGRGRDQGGAGLGLALVRAVANAHGGRVTVGVSPLGGARFSVRLPVAD